MMAAAAMMFVSCSNEEELVNVPGANGDETKVTLGVSVLGSKGYADMNFDNMTTLKNVAVVPFIGENLPQKPIQWTDVTSTTEPVTAQMNNTVDRFKVYGNLTDDQFGKTASVYGLTNADFALQEIVGGEVNGEKMYSPHAKLYFFKNADNFGRATEGASWADAVYSFETGAIGNAKYIKVSEVNYAVGTLVAAVMNGDDSNCFYTNEGLTEGATNAAGAGVKVSAILIDGQKDFDVDFKTINDGKTVYEEADKEGAFSTVRVSDYEDWKNGNIFSIVSPTSNAEEVNVNIEFTLPQDFFLKKTDGTAIGSADADTKFYLGLKLTKGDHEVFAAGYTTFLNATVKNWGIATDKPVEVTNAEIGVEFDTTWKVGNVYDLDI